MKTNRILHFILILFSFFISSCFALENLQMNVLPKYGLEENDEYVVVWNRTDIDMYPNNRRPSMVGGSGRIIVIGSKRQPLALTKIYGLESLSGDDVGKYLTQAVENSSLRENIYTLVLLGGRK